MACYFKSIDIKQISLDFQNPRIARVLEMYRDNELTSEAISMALGASGETSGTTYGSLRESIKTNGGIIHPIIVNKIGEDEFKVIEGNTRVQIYRDFIKEGVPGDWSKISAVIFDNMKNEQVHAIRLQSHLVGPREWDPYSKAKYLNYLSNVEKLPINQIVSFSGGNANEVGRMIKAYNDMEEFYRPQLDGDTFDPRKFSAFVELQNKSVIDALLNNKFNKADFAKWVIQDNIDKMANVRLLPRILGNKQARDEFLKSNISEAQKYVDIPGLAEGLLKDATYDQLALELSRRLANISFQTVKGLKNDPNLEYKRNVLFSTLDQLKEICDSIESEE